jgi:hypothetical protein
VKTTEHDRRGQLRAFGIDLLIKGQEERALFRNDYEEGNPGGRVRVTTNAPVIEMLPEDVDRLALVRDDVVRISDTDYQAKEFQLDTWGDWTTIRLVEVL